MLSTLANARMLLSRLAARSRTEVFMPGSTAPELLRRSEEALTELIDALEGADLVLLMDERKLTGLVMTLTGGSADPAVVRGQIARLQREAAERAVA